MKPLENRDPREIDLDGQPAKLLLGNGPLALEVVSYEAKERPTQGELRGLFKARAGRRAAPVLVVASWGDGRAAVHGPTEHNALELSDLPLSGVEAVCARALDAPDRHTAIRVLHQLLPQLAERIPGLRNGGLLAMQELEHGVPGRRDWKRAIEHGRPAAALRGRAIIHALGFATEDLPGPAVLLLAKGRKSAVAVLLDRPDEIDAASDRFDGTSPVSYALAQADREHLDYVLVLAGSTLRLYPARPGVGSGRRGRSETFVELNLDLLREEDAGYLWLLFSAEALIDGGTFEDILGRSEDYAAALGVRLRERIYVDVIPQLARSVVVALGDDTSTHDGLQRCYEVALRILFRLLFVAYAEDRDLLPLHDSRVYREHSLKRIAQRIADARQRGVDPKDEPFYWNEVSAIWLAVSRGNAEWGVPRYNGALFESDPDLSPTGALIAGLSIPDHQLVPALTSLLLDETEAGIEGPVDFRSLGVREFGTIYEGLLESELSLAETDLTVQDTDGAYLPANPGDRVDVLAGAVYLHDRSGARKSTGSYYTKSFAVEHLLDGALEPSLDQHFLRLAGLSEREAGRRFFEFRVADIAMGSGHFLVAAVDRIERRMVSYLAERPLPDVREELNRLRRTAWENLGEAWSGEAIEDSQLLRRQVARRCIFGVDRNPMAVELARLSIWIHTFVPGLPLSLLDQNLIHGNSLVGIATFEEASKLIQAESGDLFSVGASERLAAARDPIEKLGRLTDATDAEIRSARDLHVELRKRTQAESDLFTILAASRTNTKVHQALLQGHVATEVEGPTHGVQAALLLEARRELAGLEVLHFPLVFPHVFLGQRRGFDVILGNPPWEEATLEEDAFWARHFPGLRSRPQWEQEELKSRYRAQRPDLVARYHEEKAAADALRRMLTAGAFPGMGTGDPDTYKAFVWRFWHLVAEDGGRIGVVLPRSAVSAKGSADFRRAVFEAAGAMDVTILVNEGEWVFDQVHPQTAVSLTIISRQLTTDPAQVAIAGPYSSPERFRAGMVKEPIRVYARDLAGWSDTASLPLLPTDESTEVFSQLRRSPRLDLDDGRGWRARPHTEMHATNDKGLMDLESAERPEGFWPIYKGQSLDLWTPDTGHYYGFGNPDVILPALQAKRMRAAKLKRSALSEFSPAWVRDQETLPSLAPRIAFRDVTNRLNNRTMIAALVPPKTFLANQAPYILWPRGSKADEAYLLGVLCSIPLDWYCRRFAERHVNFFILNPFPIPRPSADNVLRKRVVSVAGRLAASGDSFASWAEEVGVTYGPIGAEEEEGHVFELDAVVAHLYGLSEPQLVHIFETFHEGWDFEDRLTATLKHFRAWKKKV